MNEQIKKFAEKAGFEMTPWGNELLPCVHQEGPINLQLEKFAEEIIRYICVYASIADEAWPKEYIQSRRDLVKLLKAQFEIDNEHHSWVCSECGTNRMKAVCPKGHSAALTGDCPMVGNAQTTR